MGREQRNRRKEVVEGEVVSEFSGETLMHLPSVPDGTEYDEPLAIPQPPMSQPGANSGDDYGYNASRRQLIARLGIGGAAALVMGGAAAMVANNVLNSEPQVVILPNGDAASVDAANLEAMALQLQQLQQELALVRAERDELSSELEVVRAELAALQQRCGELEALNVLWNEHEAVGLDDQIRTAIVITGAILANLVSISFGVQAGIQAGQRVIDNFLRQLPVPQEGIRWLKTTIINLGLRVNELAAQIEEVVTPTSSIVTMVADFIIWILDRLPFGAGRQARAGMEAIENVVEEIPGLIDGVNTTVLTPLGTWFSDDEKKNIVAILINPLRNGVMSPSRDLLTEVTEFEESFNDAFGVAMQASLDKRAALLSQIRQSQAQLSAQMQKV